MWGMEESSEMGSDGWGLVKGRKKKEKGRLGRWEKGLAMLLLFISKWVGFDKLKDQLKENLRFISRFGIYNSTSPPLLLPFIYKTLDLFFFFLRVTPASGRRGYPAGSHRSRSATRSTVCRLGFRCAGIPASV